MCIVGRMEWYRDIRIGVKAVVLTTSFEVVVVVEVEEDWGIIMIAYSRQ